MTLKRWSVDGQTPEFLAATRMISLVDMVVETILSQLGLRSGMHVLDVGCGSGEYCFRLGAHVRDVDFTGIDLDEGFIDFAEARVRGEVGYPFEVPNSANTYRFIAGDGCSLPFGDESFDAVVSHTYLTAVPDWERALCEMKRVCKRGGTVSSVTSMTDNFYGTGIIGLHAGNLSVDDASLVNRVDAVKAQVFGGIDLVAGIPPREVPAAFARAGLRDVRCTPLAHYYCLSDSALDSEEKQRHINLLYAEERNELNRLLSDANAKALLSNSEWDRFADLVERRYRQLLLMHDNDEWNWYGNASLLVCGEA